MPVSVSPENYDTNEVEEAFLAACRENAFRGQEEFCARLSQMVCFWHRIGRDGRQEVISYLEDRDYLPSPKTLH